MTLAIVDCCVLILVIQWSALTCVVSASVESVRSDDNKYPVEVSTVKSTFDWKMIGNEEKTP